MEQIDKKTLVKKARQHLENGSLQEALRIYQDILAIDPEYSQALHDLGMIQFDAGNISEAILLLKKTTQHEDKRPDFHNNLGTFLTPRLHLRYVPIEKFVIRYGSLPICR